MCPTLQPFKAEPWTPHAPPSFPFLHVGPSPQQDSSPRLSHSLVAQTVKNLPAVEPAGDLDLIPGSERFPEGNGNPLQYACLENPMERRTWRATVHGVRHNWATNTFTHSCPGNNCLEILACGFWPFCTSVSLKNHGPTSAPKESFLFVFMFPAPTQSWPSEQVPNDCPSSDWLVLQMSEWLLGLFGSLCFGSEGGKVAVATHCCP